MSSIVLAFSGGLASSSAIPWLIQTTGTDVVTLTLDVGQREALAALRARALAAGAVRAHAIDAREELTREFLLPSLSGPPPDGSLSDQLVLPLVARKLVDVARIEGTGTVAHGAPGAALDEAVHAIDPDIEVLAPARSWTMTAGELAAYARARGVSWVQQPGDRRVDQTLWGRTVTWQGGGPPERPPVRAGVVPDPAHLEIAFECGVPVSVNGVPMSPVELVESVALIAGRHGVGRLEVARGDRRIVYDAPAALVLHAARAAADGAGVVRLSLFDGRCEVLAPHDPRVVNHA